MAYVLGHPLLVIVENGSRNEGLLEAGFDWYVQYVDLESSVLSSKQFLGALGAIIAGAATLARYIP